MMAKSPEEVAELMDKAFNEGDIEGVLSFYEDAAVVVIEPGTTESGRERLKDFFERVKHTGLSAEQLKTHVIEAEGIALFLSRWTLHSRDVNGAAKQTFIATSVFRRQPTGEWKALIDNPFGPLVLGPE